MIKRILTDDDLSKINKTIENIEKSGLESNRILVENLKSKEVEASTNDDLRTNVEKVADIRLGSKVPLKATNDLISLMNSQNKSIELKWSSPSNVSYEGIIISEFKEDVLVRNESRIPQNINDGVKVGTFTKNKHKYTAFSDKNIILGKTYYYAVFSITRNNLVTLNGTTSILADVGIAIKNLPVGALIQSNRTTYYNEPIVWLKLADNHPGYPTNSVTLLTNQVITNKAFDAKEPNNLNSDRKKYGNNRYIYSNIRQWLNSSATNWYRAQHSTDEPPAFSKVDYNYYDSEKGFLANFSKEFRNSILTTNLKVLKSEVDGSGLDNFNDKVFLLSSTEVGPSENKQYEEGIRFQYFSSQKDRIATRTESSLKKDEYKNSEQVYWHLRTPRKDDSAYVLTIWPDGSRASQGACSGRFGIRPALNIKSDVLVTSKPNSNGYYEMFM